MTNPIPGTESCCTISSTDDEQNAGLRTSHMNGSFDYAMNTLNSDISPDHRQQLPAIFDSGLLGAGDSSNNEQILSHETFEDKTASTRTTRDCTYHKLDWPSYGIGHAAKNQDSQDHARIRSDICKAEAPQRKSRSRKAPHNADEDTEKHRSRGRPRLDSCDENAGDAGFPRFPNIFQQNFVARMIPRSHTLRSLQTCNIAKVGIILHAAMSRQETSSVKVPPIPPLKIPLGGLLATLWLSEMRASLTLDQHVSRA